MEVLAGALFASYPAAWTDVSKKGRRLTVVRRKTPGSHPWSAAQSSDSSGS
jgi:hypothetical protein